MSKKGSIIWLIGSLLILGSYFFPIWQITLEAPQYPDGLRLDIWLNKIGGSSDDILQNINILNHYIGMKKIEPDSIPELRILPWIVAFFAASGVIFALLRKRWLLWLWLILFVLFGVLAIYDFYLWEYDYGHNLDPKAPIKVPGMAYQPPLFGEKWLLNFRALSYPATGAYFMLASLGMGFLAAFTKTQPKS